MRLFLELVEAACFVGLLWGFGVANDERKAAESRTALAEKDAKFYEEASRLFGQQRQSCYVARDLAQEQRDICAAGTLRQIGATGQPARFYFRDGASGAQSYVDYVWDVPTATWRRP